MCSYLWIFYSSWVLSFDVNLCRKWTLANYCGNIGDKYKVYAPRVLLLRWPLGQYLSPFVAIPKDDIMLVLRVCASGRIPFLARPLWTCSDTFHLRTGLACGKTFKPVEPVILNVHGKRYISW